MMHAIKSVITQRGLNEQSPTRYNTSLEQHRWPDVTTVHGPAATAKSVARWMHGHNSGVGGMHICSNATFQAPTSTGMPQDQQPSS